MKKYDVHTNGKYTLEQWCLENNRDDIMERWDYSLNNITPSEVKNLWSTSCWFMCENKKHPSKLRHLGNVIRTGKVPACPICNSFGVWCETHNRLDLLKRWDYNLNDKTPYDVSISTTKKYYFKCPRGIHKSELKDLNNLRKQFGTARCYQCESIGQFGIDNVDSDFIIKYWSEKNIKNPFEINKNASTKIWIKCQSCDHHPDYDVSAVNFQKGERCPYCAKKRLVKEDSLGFLYPKSFDVWVEKKATPFDYFPFSNKSVYWKCETHGEYRRPICASVDSNFNCPFCVREALESKLQGKIRRYLERTFGEVNHENKCSLTPLNPDTNYPLLYDNEIVDLKLFIEVHGEQHYKTSSFNYNKNKEKARQNLEYRQTLDKYKESYALNHGYEYLCIPYWMDDEKETWKIKIEKKVESIRMRNSNA